MVLRTTRSKFHVVLQTIHVVLEPLGTTIVAASGDRRHIRVSVRPFVLSLEGWNSPKMNLRYQWVFSSVSLYSCCQQVCIGAPVLVILFPSSILHVFSNFFWSTCILFSMLWSQIWPCLLGLLPLFFSIGITSNSECYGLRSYPVCWGYFHHSSHEFHLCGCGSLFIKLLQCPSIASVCFHWYCEHVVHLQSGFLRHLITPEGSVDQSDDSEELDDFATYTLLTNTVFNTAYGICIA